SRRNPTPSLAVPKNAQCSSSAAEPIAFPAPEPILDRRSDSGMIPIETPCEKICIVEPQSGLCRGCGRSLAEIERWAAYSDAERPRMMAELAGRVATMSSRVEAGQTG